MPSTTRSFLAGMLLSACLAGAVFAAPPTVADSTSPAREPKGLVPRPLTLPAAISRAFAANFELEAARAVVSAAEASARQAGSFANPELSLDIENFAGSDTLQGFDGAETTLRLAQTFELGGKRGQRRALGDAAHQVASRQQSLTQAELYVRTVEAFMTLLAAQQQVELAETRLDLATRTRSSIQAQIEGGKVSAIAGVRSQPLLVEARLERDRAQGTLRVARQRLAALLASEDGETLVVDGELAALPDATAAGAPETTGMAVPQLALAAATCEQAAQELVAEKLRTIPDVTLGLGVRRFEENREHALVAGLSVPLPLFDRNRHGIAAAAARLEQARSSERNVQLSTKAALVQAAQELDVWRNETRALQDELLPAAQQAFEAVDFGYRAGKFGLLDLLDAQRQLSEVQARLLSARVECHVAAARLDALRGRFPLTADLGRP